MVAGGIDHDRRAPSPCYVDSCERIRRRNCCAGQRLRCPTKQNLTGGSVRTGDRDAACGQALKDIILEFTHFRDEEIKGIKEELSYGLPRIVQDVQSMFLVSIAAPEPPGLSRMMLTQRNQRPVSVPSPLCSRVARIDSLM